MPCQHARNAIHRRRRRKGSHLRAALLFSKFSPPIVRHHWLLVLSIVLQFHPPLSLESGKKSRNTERTPVARADHSSCCRKSGRSNEDLLSEESQSSFFHAAEKMERNTIQGWVAASITYCCTSSTHTPSYGRASPPRRSASWCGCRAC